MAVALCEQGLYKWDDFRDHLIAEIAAVERAEGADTAHSLLPGYYEHWLASFERLLVEKGLFTKEEIDTRKAKLESDQV